MGQRSEDQVMDAGNAKRIMKEFPWLWGIFRRWNFSNFMVVIGTATGELMLNKIDKPTELWVKLSDTKTGEEILKKIPSDKKSGIAKLICLDRDVCNSGVVLEYFAIAYNSPNYKRITVYRSPWNSTPFKEGIKQFMDKPTW